MFTGIVEEVGKVSSALPDKLTIEARSVLQDTQLGSSIDVNGVCLTVTAFSSSSFTVDIMEETIKRSNLGSLVSGDKVNLERPLTLGGRLGGHLVQGHVDATGRIASISRTSGAMLIKVVMPPLLMRYIVEKGFVAVDGISLTVANRDASSFTVSVVDFTRDNTNLGDRRSGDPVNIEVDIIAKYVEQLSRPSGKEITFDLLKEHGFLS